METTATTATHNSAPYECNHDTTSRFVTNDHCCEFCEHLYESETTMTVSVSTGNDEEDDEVTNEYVLVHVLKGFFFHLTNRRLMVMNGKNSSIYS